MGKIKNLNNTEYFYEKNIKSTKKRSASCSEDELDVIKKAYLRIKFDEMLKQNEKHFEAFLYNAYYQDELRFYRTEDYGTLIHVCCEENKPQFLQTLICKIGCEIQRQNFRGQTALHLAIESKNEACIDAILCIFEKIEDETSQLFLQFYEMLKAYTHKGYTVIHECVIQNSAKTLQRLLLICKQRKIDVLQMEVLGAGESLLHLALKSNNEKITEIILEHEPNAIQKTDYSGECAYQMNCLTKKMRLHLLECVLRQKNPCLLNRILGFYTKKKITGKFKNKSQTTQDVQLDSKDLVPLMMKETTLNSNQNSDIVRTLRKYIPTT